MRRKYRIGLPCPYSLPLSIYLGLLLKSQSVGRWDFVLTVWSEQFCVLVFIWLEYSRHRRISRK